MAVVENGEAVQRLDARDLARQRLVIGLVKLVPPPGDLGLVRLLALAPDRHAVEIGQRHQSGRVLAGIKARARGVAIGVDDIAMERGAHGGGTRQEPVIEALDMPVRVG